MGWDCPGSTPAGRAWTLFWPGCQLPTRAAPSPCGVVLARGDTYQGKGHTDHRGQTEADLDGFREVLGPVYVQAKNQRPQDPKHDEQSPTEACKLLEEERRPGRLLSGHRATRDPGGGAHPWDTWHHQGAHAGSLSHAEAQAELHSELPAPLTVHRSGGGMCPVEVPLPCATPAPGTQQLLKGRAWLLQTPLSPCAPEESGTCWVHTPLPGPTTESRGHSCQQTKALLSARTG